MKKIALILSLAACAFAADLPRPAPDISIALPGGKAAKPGDYRGKVVVLTFFLTTCPHCQKAITYLAAIQKDSVGAGHVFAKTGTFGSEDKLNGKGMLNAKGLAGYVTTKSGERLAFAAYVNHVALPDDEPAENRYGFAFEGPLFEHRRIFSQDSHAFDGNQTGCTRVVIDIFRLIHRDLFGACPNGRRTRPAI